jgi:predicted RNA binding protein YcfA (HicA-like mRNA interferase family)
VPRKLQELKAELRRAGFVKVRARGSHERWTHPDDPGIKITLAGADGDDAKPYQEDDVAEALLKLDQLPEAQRGRP